MNDQSNNNELPSPLSRAFNHAARSALGFGAGGLISVLFLNGSPDLAVSLTIMGGAASLLTARTYENKIDKLKAEKTAEPAPQPPVP